MAQEISVQLKSVMKLLASLLILLSAWMPAMAAVFPASTNGNNVFSGVNAFANQMIATNQTSIFDGVGTSNRWTSPWILPVPGDVNRTGMLLSNVVIYGVWPSAFAYPVLSIDFHNPPERIVYMGASNAFAINVEATAQDPRLTLGFLDGPGGYRDGLRLRPGVLGIGEDANILANNKTLDDDTNYIAWLVWNLASRYVTNGSPNCTNVIRGTNIIITAAHGVNIRSNLVVEGYQSYWGSLSDSSLSLTVGTGVSSVAVPITGNWSGPGSLNGFDTDGGGTLTNLHAGYYSFSCSLTIITASGSDTFNIGISTNGISIQGISGSTYASDTVTGTASIAPFTTWLPANTWIQLLGASGNSTAQGTIAAGTFDVVKR